MKYKKILTIGAVIAFCMTFQLQSVCAQEIIEEKQPEETLLQNNTDEQALEEATETQENQLEGDLINENPDADDSTEEPPQEDAVQELPVPEKVTGLRTTCESDQKVLLEWSGSENAAYYKVYRRKGNGAYKMLGETEAPVYTDTSASYGKTYDYLIVACNEGGEEGAGATIRLAHTQAVNIKTQKYTFRQMETDMRELEKQYSDYCELTPIGTSVEGRTIYDFAIGNPDAKKSLLVVSTLHAREYICSAVLMQEIEYYLRYYHSSLDGATPAEVLKDMQIHYIVMANPDGVTISQTTYARWKANSRGVDLNANFPAERFVVTGKRGPAGYSGKKALSEPETRAISAFTKKLKMKQQLLGVVNYHAMGQIVFGDCTEKSIKKDTLMMYQIARNLTGYRDAGGYSSGKSSSSGQYREYVMYLLGIPSITIEVGCTTAPCAYWEYASAFQKNMLVVLKIADAL